MCGLAGFVDFSGRSDFGTLRSMADCLSHRGPDDSGYEIFNTGGASVGLGFRRLAILDLSPTGHQPMTNKDTGDWIVLNGEIYNFKEIRKELENLNFTFRSSSDTEVVLRAYQQWGMNCVHKFIGMFAIVIYDQQKKKLICLRDRAGVKPFFYYWNNNQFLFASELKAFHRHPDFKKEIDNNAVALFFQHGYIPAPYCIFKNAFKLFPGNYLELDLETKKINITKYWDVFDVYNQPKLSITFEDALRETDSLLSSAFNYRMVSDVPVGIFLSGGYDSSCVAGILQKNRTGRINTYTIGFEEKEYNEAHHAKEVATFLGTNHHEYYCTFKEAIDLVPKLPEIYDEPFGDPSAVPTTLVSKVARNHVTVALSADGGDELFAGYPRHINSLSVINKLRIIPGALSKVIDVVETIKPGKNLSRVNRMDKLKYALKNNDVVHQFGVINQSYSPGEISDFLESSYKTESTIFDEGKKLNLGNDTLNKILAVEFKTYLLEDILQKVDRATMSVGLEGREPFLDHRIVEFVSKLPSAYKMKNGNQKILLKELVHRMIPEKIMNRPKMGFRVPLEKWCKNELKELLLETTAYERVKNDGVLNPDQVKKMIDGYLANGYEDFQRIWLLFVFQLWYDRWMN